jgi:O-antigen/teichoic acid export membrane protein
MAVTLISTIINIALNIILIPILGITGAAIATSSAYIIEYIIIGIKLYSTFKIQPFTKNYFKPIAASFLAAFIIVKFIKNFFSPLPLWMLPLLLILFIAIYGLSILFTKSFDKEDIEMLLTIEKRLGINLRTIKTFSKRFI